MEFGLLTDFGSVHCNYGDYVQSIAVEYIYQKMGIQQSEIIPLAVRELALYDGEPLLLPYNYVLHFFLNHLTGKPTLSPKIIPVFLGVSVEFATFTSGYSLQSIRDPENGWLDLFRRAEPVGCRDAYTMDFLRKMGISAYLQGCITNVFPARPTGKYEKVLLVDCPKEFLGHIPKELLRHAEVLSNAEYIGGLSAQENYRKIKERYQYYRDHASLVITSRYHVATPCNAMGIPTIFVRRAFDKHVEDIRLDTLNPNIQMCSSKNVPQVDWHPKWRDFPELKAQIAELASARIRESFLRYENTQKIQAFYQPRISQYPLLPKPGDTCKRKIQDFIVQTYPSAAAHFYIWGATTMLCSGNCVPLAEFAAEANPRLEFKGWLDTYKTGELVNKRIYSPDRLHIGEDEFIIVAAETAVPSALEYAAREGLSANQLFILVNEMAEKNDVVSLLKD